MLDATKANYAAVRMTLKSKMRPRLKTVQWEEGVGQPLTIQELTQKSQIKPKALAPSIHQ